MNILKIKNFKVYHTTEEVFTVNFSNKNFLLYGDNGSGKSSIFEAIKVCVFKDKIEPKVPIGITPEEKTQIQQDFWNKYNNKQASDSFTLELNDIDHASFDNSNYNVLMISSENISVDSSIRLDVLLKKLNFDTEDIETFCKSKYQEIESSINIILKEKFKEDIKIEIDAEDNFKIKIIDTKKNIETKNECDIYFNEAKLNLIILLLLFESIEADISKKNILVLDDFITSLDVSNRTFMIKYIFDKFEDFQIVILTHNIFFYNLIMYIIYDIYNSNNKLKKEKWKFANLYEINNKHKIYTKDDIEKICDIEVDYNKADKDISLIGNRLRQKFEILLYEFSKLITIGAVEESRKIIEHIGNGKALYQKGTKSSIDLI